MGGSSILLLLLSLTAAASSTVNSNREDSDSALKILPQHAALKSSGQFHRGSDDVKVLPQHAALKSPGQFHRGLLRSAYSRLRRSHDRLPRSDQLPSTDNEAMMLHFAQQMNELTASVSSLTNDVQRLSDQNKALQEQVVRLESQTTTLSAKLDQSDQTVQQQEAVIQTLSARFTAFQAEVTQKLQKQNESAQELNSDLAGVRSEILGIELRQNTTSNDLLEHSVRIVSLTQRVTSAENKTVRLEENTGNLARSLLNVSADVTAINMTQRKLASDVAGLEGKEQQLSGNSSRLQTDINQLANKLVSFTRSVVFFARLSESTRISSHNPIIMDEIVANQGDAYKATTGIFTVPVDGDYFFTATALPERFSQNTPRIQLMLDNSSLFLGDSAHAIVPAALRLRAGQQVWVRSLFSGAYGQGMYFSGVLVNPVLLE